MLGSRILLLTMIGLTLLASMMTVEAEMGHSLIKNPQQKCLYECFGSRGSDFSCGYKCGFNRKVTEADKTYKLL